MLFKNKLGLDEGIQQFGSFFSGFCANNCLYSLIPRSKLANPGQNTSTFVFDLFSLFLNGSGPRPVFINPIMGSPSKTDFMVPRYDQA